MISNYLDPQAVGIFNFNIICIWILLKNVNANFRNSFEE